MSDSVPSLSDRLTGRFAQRICAGFPIEGLPENLRTKSVQTGNPVRGMMRQGTALAGQRITGFSGKRSVVMFTGGSQGARALNTFVEEHFAALLDLADVIHLTGIGKELSRTHARYFSRAMVTEELPHLYALADIVVTRAGAGTLSELAALKKAAVVIPLEGVAHDHQLRNAEFLASKGAVRLRRQEELSSLLSDLKALLASPEEQQTLGENLSTALPAHAAENIAEIVMKDLAEKFPV